MRRALLLVALTMVLSGAALARGPSVSIGIGIHTGPPVYRHWYPGYGPWYPVYGPRYPAVYAPGYRIIGPHRCGPHCRYHRWIRHERREYPRFRRHELCERGYWRYCDPWR
ncbi:MAG: hypothetical protein ACE14L_10685 [Terriglobales bacterium]